VVQPVCPCADLIVSPFFIRAFTFADQIVLVALPTEIFDVRDELLTPRRLWSR
jgi:hypothetical protein